MFFCNFKIISTCFEYNSSMTMYLSCQVTSTEVLNTHLTLMTSIFSSGISNSALKIDPSDSEILPCTDVLVFRVDTIFTPTWVDKASIPMILDTTMAALKTKQAMLWRVQLNNPFNKRVEMKWFIGRNSHIDNEYDIITKHTPLNRVWYHDNAYTFKSSMISWQCIHL